MEQDPTENASLKRRQLLITLVQKELGKNASGVVTFDIADLQKYQLLKDLDGLVRAFDRLQEELKPDFEYRMNQFMPRREGTRHVGTKQGIKVIVDDVSRLSEYLGAPTKKPVLGFDPNKSRLYVRGKEIKIQKASEQYHTLRIIFEDSKEIAKEWFFSDIAERVDPHKPAKRTYSNAAYQVRLKLDAAGFPNFFKTTKQSVQIAPEYLS